MVSVVSVEIPEIIRMNFVKAPRTLNEYLRLENVVLGPLPLGKSKRNYQFNKLVPVASD